MLKYQVRSSTTCRTSSGYASSAGSSNDNSLTSRCNSMTSLSSVDSSEGDWGALKIYTWNVKAHTDYKTIRVNGQTTSAAVIDTMLNKFKFSARDPNLFNLYMEVITKNEGRTVKSLLRLDKESRPLELQRCHPADMSRFILHLSNSGKLVRVHDHHIAPESNYKSLMLAEETTCETATSLVLQMNRRDDVTKWGLFVEAPEGEAQIPPETPLVPIAALLQPEHKIIIKPSQL